MIADAPDNLFFFDQRWPVLYLDNHLLALYKPSGLLVQGDRTGDRCLLELGKRWLKARFHKPGKVFLAVVHRLDRPVAGVVLFARTSKAANRLSQQFREHSVQKRYLAVVRGTVKKRSDRLVHHIQRRYPSSRVVSASVDGSQKAVLCYQVLDKHQQRSLLEITPETGRRHQIRVQLAHIGHPLIGDLRYGTGRPLPGKPIALLSRQLSVQHPTRGTRLDLVSPVPSSWAWPGIDHGEANRPVWRWQSLKRHLAMD